jgi:hypothetical protein
VLNFVTMIGQTRPSRVCVLSNGLLTKNLIEYKTEKFFSQFVLVDRMLSSSQIYPKRLEIILLIEE